MQIIFDIGNTLIKYALFKGKTLQSKGVLESSVSSFLKKYESTAYTAIISSVKNIDDLELMDHNKIIVLNEHTPLPIALDYDTPHTLGKDRIANAVGAYASDPKKSHLVIDMGTCINYEFITNGVFMGGLISPGVDMRLKAMHQFTGKLPFIENATEELNTSKNLSFIGKNTIENIKSGVLHGIIGEINYNIEQYKRCKNVDSVILTGGDAKYFEKHINYNIFVNENLTLIGLNEILLYQKH